MEEITSSSPQNDQLPEYHRFITVLSIDGGGIKGILPAVILDFLESQLQVRNNKINLFPELVERSALINFSYKYTGARWEGCENCGLLRRDRRNKHRRSSHGHDHVSR